MLTTPHDDRCATAKLFLVQRLGKSSGRNYYCERPVSCNRVRTIMAFGVPYRVPVIVDSSESPQLSLYNKAFGVSLTEGQGRGIGEKGMLG